MYDASHILHTGSFTARDAAGHEYRIDVEDEHWAQGENLSKLKQYHRQRRFYCFITKPWKSARCEAFLVTKGQRDIHFGAEDIRVTSDDPLADTDDGWQGSQQLHDAY